MSTVPVVQTPVVAPPPLHGPWQATDPWRRRWPVTGRPPVAATVIAVLTAGVVAALAVPLDRTGAGWLVTALAGATALKIPRLFPDSPAPGAPLPLVVRDAPRVGPERYGWTAATVALIAVGLFRSAGWLFVLCLLTATLTGALAITGGRSMRSITTGYWMQVFAAFRALPWLAAGGRRIGHGPGRNVRIVWTVGVSALLLVVFGALFASADPAFADVLAAIVPNFSALTLFRWVLLAGLTCMIVGGAAFLRANPPDLSGLDGTEGRKVNRIEWAVPLGLLVVLFAGFVIVQLTVLFGGDRHVLATDGLTYANYARGGFWQLSFVTVLTLFVLAGAARWAPRRSPIDRVLIRAILGALAGLTLVIVASALLRMNLYAQTYGLTRLRLLVAACELWFGFVLLLVLVAGLRILAAWLPRVAIAAGVAALLGLAVANPDGMIASYNIQQNRSADLLYLGGLSPDAAPALTALNPADRECVLGRMSMHLSSRQEDGWRGWNLGRERARRVLAEQHVDGPTWRCS
ncbi:DUF4173 domain-containing protein [Actinoplanes sp. TBRC 11911]|uniref:DUF4153 domain-containing protein n=1 Tax=Actinoplanes sp. TBRC 11911 TaxID=2729386 RepID=UPI00145CCD95|nr:DUF4173 domain-containing protein [Actinoplanes sp. TBRC 11911]NMO54487.1 DUF4173 domain-containing protein [Actinoplanes sp. TBRC 11911]